MDEWHINKRAGLETLPREGGGGGGGKLLNLREMRSLTGCHIKPRPKDHNMSTQHIATLLGITCCAHLATMLRRVATCWVLLAQV